MAADTVVTEVGGGPARSSVALRSASPPYSSPSMTYAQAPTYTQAQGPVVQREVVYPNGRYLLYGDGVTQPWQWVWQAATPPPPPLR
jgi:hypothetical protein